MQYEKIFGINVYSSNSIKPLTKILCIERIHLHSILYAFIKFYIFFFIKDEILEMFCSALLVK